MEFRIEGLEEGWFYWSMENEKEKAGMVVSYLGEDAVRNLFVTLKKALEMKKGSYYFSWTQEPEYQMMQIEKKRENEWIVRVYDFAREIKYQTGRELPPRFSSDEKVVFVCDEKGFFSLIQSVLDEFSVYREGEGKQEFKESWIHIDQNQVIPFPEKEWQQLGSALQRKMDKL